MNLGRKLREASAEDLAIALALAGVAVFLVWAAIRFREIVGVPYGNSDVASSLLLAEFFPDRGSGHVVLGNYPWWEGLLPLHWTRWLPEHVAVWKTVPFVIYGATVVLVGWTVRRAVSPRAGLVVALAMAAPAPYVIYMLGVSNQRLPALAHTVVLAAFLVTLPSLPGWGRTRQAIWGLALAATLAPGIATDSLIVAAAFIPFLGAIALGWRLGMIPRGIALIGGAACIAGGGAGWLLAAIAENQRIVYNHGLFEMAGAGRLLSNIALLLENIGLFAHGKLAERDLDVPVNAFNMTRELIVVAVILATIALGYVAARSARPILTDAARPAQARLLAIYWGLSIVAVSLAFIAVTAPVGTNAVRFVTTLWPALLTLLVIIYGRRALTGLALLAAFCAIVGCIELGRGLYTVPNVPGSPPNNLESQLLARFAQENDLDHGYAGYWDAAPFTVQSDFKARVYPIEPCAHKTSAYCPFHSHQLESWYEPKENARSFYVVSRHGIHPALRPPPARWGRPVKTARIGDFKVYAYDYDISSQLQEIAPGEWGLPASVTE